MQWLGNLSLREQLLTMVTAVAENASFPLKQFNRASARNVLGTLHADADIRAAALFDGAGNMVAAVDFDAPSGSSARRWRPGARDPAGPSQQPIRFDGLTGADLQVPVTLEGDRLGTLHVDAALSGIYRQWPGSPESMLLGFVVALVVAYALSIRLQRFISAPIRDLAQAARNVCARKHFLLRADKRIDDDFGALIDDFNEM